MSRAVKPNETPRDLVKLPRRWFNARSLQAAAEQTDLGAAMVDVSKLSMAYLARCLIDKKTSHADKLTIAMAFGPRLAIERRGRPRKPVPGAVGDGEDLNELLSGYNVRATTG